MADRYADAETREAAKYFLGTARTLAVTEPECLARRMAHDAACVEDTQQALPGNIAMVRADGH
jgi:hypothetical protein